MSYHPGQQNTGLRWREDTGIEKRCDACPKGMNWWPLTEEFWYFRKSFNRCIACYTRVRNASQSRIRRENDLRRLANLDYQRKYRAETKGARKVKNQVAYWSDPETHRAKARERYYRNRDAILERKRALYWAEKEAA
jgi:hypothetical protein